MDGGHRQHARLACLDDPVRYRGRSARHGGARYASQIILRPPRHTDPVDAGRRPDRAGAGGGGDVPLSLRRGGDRGSAAGGTVTRRRTVGQRQRLRPDPRAGGWPAETNGRHDPLLRSAYRCRYRGHDRRQHPRDPDGKSGQSDLRGTGRACDLCGGKSAGRHDPARQYLGDATAVSGDPARHRPDHPRLHQICRRPFRRHAGVGNRRAGVFREASRHRARAWPDTPVPTIAGWAAVACARWRSA